MFGPCFVMQYLSVPSSFAIIFIMRKSVLVALLQMSC